MKHRIRAAGLLASLAVGVAAAQAPPSQQSPTPTFRAQVESVEVDALVTDQRGNVVRDLTKEDFRIFEDGRPQAIGSLEIVDIPVEGGRSPRPIRR